MAKVNCWEFFKCGKEPEGTEVYKFGICPATIDNRTYGIHGGRYGGRVCWVIAGTFCGDKIQERFATKFADCFKCDFYQLVRKEEGENYVHVKSLLEILK